MTMSPPPEALPDQTANDTPSVVDLIADVTADVSRLFQQQLELAKAELKQEAAKAGKAGEMLVAAAVAGLLVVVLGSLAAVFGLAEVMPAGLAALVVGFLWAVVGVALYRGGRRRLRNISAVPRQTVETLKEDMQWLRNRSA